MRKKKKKNSSRRLDHPLPPRVLKDPPGVDHGARITQGLQRVDLARLHGSERVSLEVDDHLLPRLELVTDANSICELARVELPRGHAVAEEDPRVGLGDDDARPGRSHGHGCVLSRGAAPEVVPSDDDRVVGLHLPLGDEASRIEVFGQADQRVGSELLVLVGLGRDEREVLGRDDLVGVDVLFLFFSRLLFFRRSRLSFVCVRRSAAEKLASI